MSATGVSVDLVRELRAICGQDHVCEQAQKPMTCVPASVEEVSAVLRLANERGFSVLPRGGWTDRFATEVDVALDTSRLNAVEHYDAGDLTVGIGAGTTVEQLKQLVGRDQLMFACDPAFPERATIGGVLAAAKQGPLRHGYGAVRDYCIGIRFVTGDGRIGKGGGRVVKNVAGYDLMKLLIGCYGSLAVITSASFKLFPAPRQTRTFVAEFASLGESLQFRDTVLRSPLSPMCLEIVSPAARKMMRPRTRKDAWVICARASGSDAVLARYRKELGSAITRELDGDKESEMWRAVEDFPESQADNGWVRVVANVPIAEFGAAIEIIGEAGGEAGPAVIGRAGVGTLVAAVAAEQVDTAVEAFARRRLPDCSITVHGRGKLVRITPSDVNGMRAVKNAVDPNNVLRGRELF